MPQISRRDLVLLLVSLGATGEPDDHVSGITRLQKLLYLLEKEEGLTPSGDQFEFTAWKAGPYSSKLYDDLEFLENLGLLQSEIASDASAAEAAEMAFEDPETSPLTFEDLIASDDDEGSSGEDSADLFEERRFSLTPEGLERVTQRLASGDYAPIVQGIRRIKSRYSSYSLDDLLYHVYTKYPEMTVESEIKDQVLSRGRPRRA